MQSVQEVLSCCRGATLTFDYLALYLELALSVPHVSGRFGFSRLVSLHTAVHTSCSYAEFLMDGGPLTAKSDGLAATRLSPVHAVNGVGRSAA